MHKNKIGLKFASLCATVTFNTGLRSPKKCYKYLDKTKTLSINSAVC